MRLGRVPAGHYRGRKIDELILYALPERVPGLKAELRVIPRSPNTIVIITYGDLRLAQAPRPRVPVYRTLPKKSKSRARLAWESVVEPQQRTYFGGDELPGRGQGDYIFGLLTHYPDRQDKSVLGGLDLVLVDQNYNLVGIHDLLARAKAFALAEPEEPQIERVQIRRKGIA